MKTLSLTQPLASIFWTNKINPFVRRIGLVIGGSLLIAMAAHVNIPLQPVPITLQTLAVFFIAMTYGWRLGVATILLYLAEGAMGLPVFAGNQIGLLVILGSTGGYLLGWIPAVIISGFLIESGWGKNYIGVILAGLLGSIPIYICGLAVLSQFVGLTQAILLGLKPFLLGDTLKIIFLAFIVPVFWQKNREQN